MIEWLVQSANAHADLRYGVAPAGLLAPEERARLALLHLPKRRLQWLLGRWTAKQLLRGTLEQTHGWRVPLDSLVLRPERSGAPRAFLMAESAADAVELPLSLSISHRETEAFCALSRAPRVRVGADLELIEPRTASFVADYLTCEEQALVRAASDPERDRLVTAIWSGKEAVLKALRLGLTVDTRRVCCLPETDSAAGDRWQRLDVRCQPVLLRTAGLAPRSPCVIRAWWQAEGPWIRTVAALAERPSVEALS